MPRCSGVVMNTAPADLQSDNVQTAAICRARHHRRGRVQRLHDQFTWDSRDNSQRSPKLGARPSWSCYTRLMKLPPPTASLHQQIARCLWRNAPTLPKAERLKALRNAQLHAGLARALDANPDLGLAKSLSESAIPDVVYCPFPPTRDAGERGEVE
jgi:hypothetical protein